jgi:ABC-2 type transport system permease protein
MSPLLEEFAQNARDQQRFVETLKYLSPGTLTFRSLTTLSGSDGDQHARFRDVVANYHDEWRQFFLTRLQTGTPLAANDYTQLPRFSPPQYDWREMVKTLVIPLLFMIGLTLMICLQASRRLREPGVIVGRSA